MKFLLISIFIIFFILLVVVNRKINELKNLKYYQPKLLAGKKILTVYYSNGGNTKNVAENLNFIVGGDLKEIQLLEKYPTNIFNMSKLVRKQMAKGDLPKIENIDISDYDVIFVGFPIWGFSISLPIKSFLKNNNFENKTLIPFFTCSGGISKNKVTKELKDFTNAKEVKKPLFMFENGIFLVKEQIIKWLNNI